MSLRKRNAVEHMPLYTNPDIVTVDLFLNGEKIEPKTLLTLEGDRRTVYVFHRFCHNIALDKSWADLRNRDNGEWRSVRVDKIRGVYVAKKSRVKKK